VRFVINCILQMHGGEVFVPKVPSMNIMDLAVALAPGCEVDNVGMRPGEKMHEVLISEDEARHTLELDDMYVVQPAHPWWTRENWIEGRALPDGFRYSSDQNSVRLEAEELIAFGEDVK
jgi:UDP-N-acetylglucosamine 4,6-dehydratase